MENHMSRKFMQRVGEIVASTPHGRSRVRLVPNEPMRPFASKAGRNALRIARTAALALLLPAFASGAGVTLVHVHGLSYSADGKRLMIPSHDGLAVYENGKWSKAPGPQHDYMGFSATARNVYSSGHPAPGSGVVNPFGLLRSRDGGRTWDKLGLEGESDFHVLATGWSSNAVYVWNAAPNSRMRDTGLHYTVNDGLSWKAPRAQGLQGEPHALAVHPDDPATVAAATATGVFVSRDSGESFVPLQTGAEALSVFFDLDGRRLWVGTFAGEARLARVALAGGKAQPVRLPALGRDAVAYIAQNPKRRDEYAIATFTRSVYLSTDAGRTWTSVAVHGQTR
jgi:photosystem II stability/assembly factor-like uncharacterized protein